MLTESVQSKVSKYSLTYKVLFYIYIFNIYIIYIHNKGQKKATDSGFYGFHGFLVEMLFFAVFSVCAILRESENRGFFPL